MTRAPLTYRKVRNKLASDPERAAKSGFGAQFWTEKQGRTANFDHYDKNHGSLCAF
jgi:hypothetical protein